jgi:hypothetical protein
VKRFGKQIKLGPALDATLRRLDRKGHSASASARVIMAWQSVAKGVISAHTTGAHMREGVLIVYVDGNSWATHFSAMSEQYRKAVNEALGQELVSGLRFIVSRKVTDEHRLKHAEEDAEEFYSKDPSQPVPLTDLELAQIRASVAEIPDAELREAVLRATVKDLEWKKGVSEGNVSPARRQDV